MGLDPIPVLVTDAQDRCGLAAIRCLGASGYAVTAAALGWGGLGLWSRYAHGRATLPDPRVDLDTFAEALGVALARTAVHAMVVGRDETLFAISERRDVLSDEVGRSVPAPEVVARALDKHFLGEASAAAELPAPEQRRTLTIKEAEQAASELGFPVMVKPRWAAFADGPRVGRHLSRVAGDRAALAAAQAEIGDALVQRHIDGTVVSFGGAVAEGRLLGAAVSRYLRTWPAEAGRASCSETITPPPGLLERIEELVGLIGWSGVFEVELLQEPSGALHALDFNPRPYGSIALARAAGAPLVTLWCDWLTEARAQPLRIARAGVRYRLAETELHHLASDVRTGDLRAVADDLRPRRLAGRPYLDIRDPIPSALKLGGIAVSVSRPLVRGGNGQRPAKNL